MIETKKMKELKRLTESLMKKDQWLEAIVIFKQNSSMVEKYWQLSWDFGWCYFRLERFNQAQRILTKAVRNFPKNFYCKYALGQVYLKKENYLKAESILLEALRVKESHVARIGLALAYLAQGRVQEAENEHLKNIRLKPKKSARYESYAAFLFDVGRDAEARKMEEKVAELRRIN